MPQVGAGYIGSDANYEMLLNPDPPILVFFIVCFFFFPCPFSLAFSCVVPFFSKDFRGSAKRKTLVLFRGFLAFSKKQGLEGQGTV